MKQLGITLIVLSVLSVISVIFKLQGVILEMLFLLVALGASIFIPEFKLIFTLKLHWRIALLFAAMCTFIIGWISIRPILGNYQDYSLSVTMFAFGLLAFLFEALDKRSS